MPSKVQPNNDRPEKMAVQGKTDSPDKIPFSKILRDMTTSQVMASGAVLVGLFGGGLATGSYAMKVEKDREILEVKQRELDDKNAAIEKMKQDGKWSPGGPKVEEFPSDLSWQWAGENWCGTIRRIGDKSGVRLVIRACTKPVLREEWPVLIEGDGTVVPNATGFQISFSSVHDHRNNKRKLLRLEGDLKPVRAYWDNALRYYYDDRPQDAETGDMIVVDAQPR